MLADDMDLETDLILGDDHRSGAVLTGHIPDHRGGKQTVDTGDRRRLAGCREVIARRVGAVVQHPLRVGADTVSLEHTGLEGSGKEGRLAIPEIADT